MSTIEKTLTVKKRDGLGKGFNRRLRTEKLVPGVYYTAAGENIPVQAETLPLQKMYNEMGRTSVFNLEIDDNGTKMVHPVLVWQVQYHPFKKEFKHIDFFGVDLQKKVKISVPVEFIGTSRGVKAGGKLETYRESMVLISKPLDMPKKITIDVSNMDINTTITVTDVVLPAGVVADYHSNYAVVSVLSKTAEDTAAEAADAAE
ncbi:MAG: 50S ribosomal protein L25/general stress protein Ctc [Desulfovibrionaceae bacterium]